MGGFNLMKAEELLEKPYVQPADVALAQAIALVEIASTLSRLEEHLEDHLERIGILDADDLG